MRAVLADVGNPCAAMWMLLLAVVVLAAANALNVLLAPGWYVPVCVVAAVLLVLIARRSGLTWDDLGLGRAAARRGLRWGLILVGAVLVVYPVGLALPFTREAFQDERAAGLSPEELVYRVLVRVPLGTVMLEEIAFRGVLWAMVRRRWGPVWATVVSSVLFGLWHVQPSRGLTRANAAAQAVFGAGQVGVALSVTAAVVGTALAGVLLCELRRRSGSLIPPVALHCALNSAGYALAWAASRWWG
ncbi:membrane protease YdiL (CAAX protease family) [Streptomyces sp. V4I23]|uniref:CPBP family intramembrane glutamic endopeptidase n=1 Tax=Streptomyces sp. V4I23 TaxID=3042282 RepID=UPI00278B63A7|nr:CPBP family intramembrane glutamic endopeptidase [Streptomyces sp. V4I23]MDQ1013050.1 membrane protease YdiL (CAAX protease family) [Streptomyces sp. V4I23]